MGMIDGGSPLLFPAIEMEQMDTYGTLNIFDLAANAGYREPSIPESRVRDSSLRFALPNRSYHFTCIIHASPEAQGSFGSTSSGTMKLVLVDALT